MEKKSFTDGVKRLGPHTYFVGAGAGAIIQFESLADNATIDAGKINSVNYPSGQGKEPVKVMWWGKNNQLPFEREELITGNNIVPAILERKRNIFCGQGWYAYKKRFVDTGSGQMKEVRDEVPMSEDQEAFFKKFNKVALQLVGELVKHSVAMPEFVLEKSGKIISMKSLKMKYVRAGKKDGLGEIPVWYWSNNWQRRNELRAEDRVLRELPVYDPNAKDKQARFVLPLMDDLFNDGYYPIPPYWGGRHWITLSNIIPLFHEANLRNGSLPRWHIIIPHDYFQDYEAMEIASDDERAKLKKDFMAKEQAFVNDFTKMMTDVSKTGRTLITKSELIEAMGGSKEKRIQVEPLEVDMKDEALIKLFEASNTANVSAQAFHPTLANIQTAKGIGSGTEIRNTFLLYLIIAAPSIRNHLLEVVDLVKQENGWPKDVYFAIRDAEMTTLAENPAGVRPAETPIGQ